MTQGTFARLLDGLPVEALLAALESRPELWEDPIAAARRDYPGSAHHDVDAIFLRWFHPLTPERAFSDLRALDYPAGLLLADELLPVLRPLYAAIGAVEIGRIQLARLKAHGRIDRHIDEGTYADHYQRFHVVLSSDAGNVFHAGNSKVCMRPGEAWWFNHKAPHFVVNDSNQARLHLIVDARRSSLP
jgi:Aspartyl/Asparaginyl beta-hydroxylase